jgi:phosphoglycerate dehydrogenase-like enzyme
MSERPTVLIVLDSRWRDRFLATADLERLGRLAEIEYLDLPGRPGIERFYASEDPAAKTALRERLEGVDALIVCHGAPRVTGDLMDAAPRLRLIGELEGDRFSYRIDAEAAWERGIRTVDTTNGSSYPVAEWALALVILSLRNAAAHFRHMIEPITYDADDLETSFPAGELYGTSVGLIGCGHIGRRLIKFLKAFECPIMVHDPYISRDIADALGFLPTTLEHVLSDNDAVVSLVPQTPRTEGMLGAAQLDLLRPGSVFVNVSRDKVVDSAALVARLRRGDICAGLDVFDPEPIPGDHPIKTLPNVFLTPHIASRQQRQTGRFFALMVDELERFFAGHETLFDLTPKTLADREGAVLQSRVAREPQSVG